MNNTRPKFAFKRDKSLLNKHNLEQFLENNTYINELFKWEEPNLIAEILFNELNIIVNSIAPKHKIQLNKKFAPYLNSKIKDRIKEQDRLLGIYKFTNSKGDHLNFKNYRNTTNKIIKEAKFSFYNEKLGLGGKNGNKNNAEIGDPLENSQGKIKKMWNEVREYTKTSNSLTPQSIIYKGRI